MKKQLLAALLSLVPIVCAHAQNYELAKQGLPFLRPSDKAVLTQQSDAFFKAIEPLSQKAGQYAVNVYSSGKMVARGTVIKEGVLTKWSELIAKGDTISVVGHDGVKREAFVKAVYLEFDLALLDYGGGLPEVDLSGEKQHKLGEFLLAVGPAKDAHGFGVVSVAPRSLRESDKAYLGVRMDSSEIRGGGVRLESVERGSAAARAGLRAGDVVTKINSENVDGIYELGIKLQSLSPGEQIALNFRRADREFAVDVVLGARPELKQFSPQRMEAMKRMGGTINEVAEGFPEVLQSDMQIEALDAGSPVFDLDGDFVGIVVARASRIKTYIMPVERVAEQLAKKPDMSASAEKQAQLIERRNGGLSAAEAHELRELRDIIERAERRILEIESGQ